ncbi:hypothetical protein TAGGR_1703 [Thermodesulfovibrio aggregans]|uniref:Uncharacterized protein n=1 Tax=Thermodesulfovibrio aggregans TaxID=86166 RepID=A0A0U9HN85_9BACT|nr:hypothetical protein [Thermodesulfovibrio aggregans]GAQ94519.1 hypothetical protein TAGGR_1703 [Thermodesulfovibrio aggregans]
MNQKNENKVNLTYKDIQTKSEDVSFAFFLVIALFITGIIYFWDSVKKFFPELGTHLLNLDINTIAHIVGFWIAINLGVLFIFGVIFGFILEKVFCKITESTFSPKRFLYIFLKMPEWIDRTFNAFFDNFGLTYKNFLDDKKAKLLWDIYTDMKTGYISNWYSLLLHVVTLVSFMFPVLYFYVKPIRRNISHNAFMVYCYMSKKKN